MMSSHSPSIDDAQHAGHARRIVIVVSFRDEPRAYLFQLAVAGLVIGSAFLLIDRAALGFTPEGAPGPQFALRANFLVEVRKQQGIELGGRGGGGTRHRVFPVLAVFGCEIKQRLGQKFFLGFEMEIHQPMGNTGSNRNIGHRRLGIASPRQGFDGGINHLLPAVFPAGFPGKRHRIEHFCGCFHDFHFD